VGSSPASTTSERAKALRGAFGAAILIAHEIHGAAAEAHLPDPAILLVVATTVLGCIFGALGGYLRERLMQRSDIAAS
jgi:NhaP-type Na+/H+ or K+/H+ antiporter